MSSAIRIRAGLRALTILAIAAGAAAGQNFTGRVLEDSSGEPVASAELKIHKAGMRELAADLDTDRAGRFAGEGLAAGDYTVDVLKPNFITATFPVHIPGAAIQIRLLRYGVMDGRVTNVRGEAVAGLIRAPYGQTIGATRLTVLAKQPGSEEFRSVRDTSLDEAGHYRFYDLPPGQYELGMWYYGLDEGSGMQMYPDNANPRIFTITGGEVYNDLNFLIAQNPMYKVSGRVALPKPGMKFALALGLADQAILPIAIALTEDDGSFRFDKVPVGSYDLFAAGPTGGYTQFESVLGGKDETVFGRIRIEVAGSDLTNIAIPLSPALSLAVVLRTHGKEPFPAACPQSASVEFTSLDPWGILFRTNSPVSLAKEQTVRNLAPGRFRIVADGLGPGCYQANELVVDLGREVPQPVPVEVAAAGSIRGIVHVATGDAIESAVLLLDAANTGSIESRLAFPDRDGHFSFETLKPGRYRIAARPAVEGSGTRWLTDLTGMKEIDVLSGDPTSVELTELPPQGGVQ